VRWKSDEPMPGIYFPFAILTNQAVFAALRSLFLPAEDARSIARTGRK
jgi:hypothetical protein